MANESTSSGWKALALALTVASASAYGAVSYRCTITQTYPKVTRVVAHVVADGNRQRIDFGEQAQPFMYDALVSSDGGKSYSGLNSQLKTWWGPVLGPIGSGGSFASLSRSDATNVESTFSLEDDENEGGYDVHKYTGHLSFVRDDMTTTVTVLIWVTDALPAAAGIRAQLTTGIRNVDAQWLPKTAAAKGFPVKIQMAVTRHYEGGRPVTNLVSADVDDVQTVEAPSPARFEIPSNYSKSAPVMAAPGAAKP